MTSEVIVQPRRDREIAGLVAEVFESAPPPERSQLIERLLSPLSLLSVVAVADGVFARFGLDAGWRAAPARLDDLQRVKATDVMALVDYAQQVSVEALDGVTQVIAGSPVLAGSAAAAMLLAALLKRANTRRRTADAQGEQTT